MDFFERVREAKQRTAKFIAFFITVYLLLALFLGVVLSFVVNTMFVSMETFWIDSLVIAVVIAIFMFVMRYAKKQELRIGSKYILNSLGAIEVDEFHENPIIRRYYQTTTEMAIAAGLKKPATYLLPTKEINALAVASNENDVAIAITEGALTRLSREELQGIIAHEMSHVLHHDSLLNFRLATWLYGLQCVYFYGRDLFHLVSGLYPYTFDRFCLGYAPYTVERDLRITPITIVVILVSSVIMLMGMVGALIARIIKAMISREREYLADAESVRLTRSRSLAEVLKKIIILENSGDNDNESYRSTSEYQEFSHFYLTDYVDHSKVGWFDTHPPIIERIKAIDPFFRLPTKKELAEAGKSLNVHTSDQDWQVENELVRYAANTEQGLETKQKQVLQQLGIDTNNKRLMGELSVCYAILLIGNKWDIDKQIALLEQNLSHEMFDLVIDHYEKETKNLKNYQRILHLIKSTPNFESINLKDLQKFQANLKKLIVADQKLSVIEYCIWKYLDHVSNYEKESIGKDGLNFTHKMTIVDLKNEVASLINIIINESFLRKNEKRDKYQEAIADFDAEIPYKENIVWFKVLEEILPKLQHLTLMGGGYLSDIFDDIYFHQRTSDDAKAIIHVACLILGLRIPKNNNDDIVNDDNNRDERIERINIYGQYR